MAPDAATSGLGLHHEGDGPDGPALARWSVARGANGRHHRLIVETGDGRSLRGMLTAPEKRVVLLTDFACRELHPALIDVAPMLRRFRDLGDASAADPGTHAQWSFTRTYGPLKWSLSLSWDGVGQAELVFKNQSASAITLTLEDAAFLRIALPAAVSGCRAELELDALRPDVDEVALADRSGSNAGARWSREEEERAWALWRQGRSLDEIALHLQRSPGAMVKRFEARHWS